MNSKCPRRSLRGTPLLLCLYLYALTLGPAIHGSLAQTPSADGISSPNDSLALEEASSIDNADTVAVPGAPNIKIQKAKDLPINYRLSPNDLIHIQVFREPELSSAARLNADGTVILPVLGQIKLAGMTVLEARENLTRLLEKDYLQKADVTVTVLQFTKYSYTILGPVRAPGVYTLTANSKIDIIRALARAGGLTKSADARDIRVQRKVKGKIQMLKVDSKAIQYGKAKPFYILPNDIITVTEDIF